LTVLGLQTISNPENRKRWLTFVIVSNGPPGSFSSAFGHFSRWFRPMRFAMWRERQKWIFSSLSLLYSLANWCFAVSTFFPVDLLFATGYEIVRPGHRSLLIPQPKPVYNPVVKYHSIRFLRNFI